MNANLAEYRELTSIVRKLVRIRVKLIVRLCDKCGTWINHTHIHIRSGVRNGGKPGLVHLATKDLALSRDGKAAVLVHEAIHLKLMLGYHSKNFWKLQAEFISPAHFKELCFPTVNKK
jgi:predicted metal-dependent hydrolase